MIHHLKILQTMASKVKWIKLKAYLAMLLASGSSFTYYQNCSIHGWGLNLKLKCSFQGPNLVSKPWCLLQGLLHESGSKCLLRGPNFSLGLSFILDSHFLLHFPQQSALEWEAKSIPVKKIGWYCWFSDLNNTIDINSYKMLIKDARIQRFLRILSRGATVVIRAPLDSFQQLKNQVLLLVLALFFCWSLWKVDWPDVLAVQ